MTIGDTSTAMRQNIAFCKSTYAYARRGSVTQAWAMGWLAGAGCFGYRMPRGLSEQARTAYRDGKEEGAAARRLAL